MEYVLSCCSTADLTAEHFKERNISYICFHFNIDGKDYPDDLGVSYPFKDFYAAMAKGSMTKTSQVSVGEYIEYFEPMLKEGKDILHLSLSSGTTILFKKNVIFSLNFEFLLCFPIISLKRGLI